MPAHGAYDTVSERTIVGVACLLLLASAPGSGAPALRLRGGMPIHSLSDLKRDESTPARRQSSCALRARKIARSLRAPMLIWLIVLLWGEVGIFWFAACSWAEDPDKSPGMVGLKFGFRV